jgi:hypothetical protein
MLSSQSGSNIIEPQKSISFHGEGIIQHGLYHHAKVRMSSVMVCEGASPILGRDYGLCYQRL